MAKSSSGGPQQEVPIETGKRHTFVLVLERINVRVLDRAGAPVPEKQCEITYDDGFKTRAKTDERGWLKVSVSKRAKYAELKIEGETTDAQRRVYLTPPEDWSGKFAAAKQRLWNLGFPVSKTLQQGVREFREEYDLELSAKIDAALEKKLEEVYEEYRERENEDLAEDPPGEDLGEEEGRT